MEHTANVLTLLPIPEAIINISLFQGGRTASLAPEGSLISATFNHTNTSYILQEVFTAFYIEQEFVMYMFLQEVSRVSRYTVLPFSSL